MTSAPRPSASSPAVTRTQRSWHVTADGLHWRLADLDDTGATTVATLLDPYEAERAARFRFQRDRDRYVTAHTALRRALSELLDQSPEHIAITRGPHGKPGLSPDLGWVFNLSHSENIAVIAAAPSAHVAEIGVDIECLRPVTDWQSLAREHFSDDEHQALVATTDHQRSRAFLRCWTRKEACVKAIGTGLTIPTRAFSVGVMASPVTISIDTGHASKSVEVHTLFEYGTCIAAIAWCPAARPKPI